MKNGTLAEKRTIQKTTTTQTNPKKDPSPELTTTAVNVVEEKPPLKEPAVMLQTIQVPDKEPVKKCSYCKAKELTTLAIRGSVVLVLLALCFNLIKTANK
ncbi:hypothetical protein [Aureispira sp. CCB-QB1]|uniref:hypothetical protein n=1 Tax=Aureispira sp. CCB-QB1 TaxID=1313421 RepID=UPI000696CDCA|nr:hypothetical protein [Aureispira sp. CCB-QB1]